MIADRMLDSDKIDVLSDLPNREGLRDDGGAASVGERISIHRRYQRLDILGQGWSHYGPYCGQCKIQIGGGLHE